jgi:hypothetical protein
MKQLIVLLIVTLLSTATFAQKHRGHHDLILSHATELNLTADQSAKLTELSKELN